MILHFSCAKLTWLCKLHVSHFDCFLHFMNQIWMIFQISCGNFGWFWSCHGQNSGGLAYFMCNIFMILLVLFDTLGNLMHFINLKSRFKSFHAQNVNDFKHFSQWHLCIEFIKYKNDIINAFKKTCLWTFVKTKMLRYKIMILFV